MTGIQIVLLTGIIFIGLYFFVKWKKRVLDIVLLSSMTVCSTIFVIFPNTTNAIAHWLGVGRGADLVFYLSILIFWFIVLKLYIRVRNLEQMFTQVIQKDALQQVKTLPTNNSANIDLE